MTAQDPTIRRIVTVIATLAAVLTATTRPVSADTTTTTSSSTSTTGTTTTTTSPPPPPPPTSTTTPTTAPPTTPPTSPPPTTSPTTAPPTSPPTTVPSTTTSSSSTTTSTTPPSTTQITISPAQLAALLNSLNADLAKATAIESFTQAKAAAAAAVAAAQAGQPLPPEAAAAAKADPGLLTVASNDLAAGKAKDEAQRRLNGARHRLAHIGVALYVHDDTAGDSSAASPNDGAALDRSVLLSMLISQAKVDVNGAKHGFDQAAEALAIARIKADQAVNARAAAIAAKAAQAAHAAAAQAALTSTTSTTSTTTAPSTGTTAPGSPGQTSTTKASHPAQAQASYGGGGPTILGSAALTGAELTAWYASSGHQARITVPLDTLTGLYQTTGANMNVRDDIAFAQAMIETGYLSFPSYGQVAPTDNNYAGIGACDTCPTGFHFPDAQTGVAAQLQLLHADATAQPVPSGPLPPPVGVSGCCPTWLALDGVWASAGGYGYHILTLYKQMLEWTLQRRQASAGL